MLICKMSSRDGEDSYRLRMIYENVNMSREISPMVVKYATPIGRKGVSDELDQIYELFTKATKNCT